ncbi:hypothetical protein M427DRAFT_495372, partial [Gonapodya prolifera JEL478]
ISASIPRSDVRPRISAHAIPLPPLSPSFILSPPFSHRQLPAMSSMSPILTRAPSLSLAPSPLSSPRLSPSHALSRSPVPPLPDSEFVKMASTFLDVEALEALGLADVATAPSTAVGIPGDSDDTVMADNTDVGQWSELAQVDAWGMQAQAQVQGRQMAPSVGQYAAVGQYGMQQWDVSTGWAVHMQTGDGWAVTAADGQAQSVGGYMHATYQPTPAPVPPPATYTDMPFHYISHPMQHVPHALPVPDQQHQHQHQQYTSYTHTALHVHASPAYHAVSAAPLPEVHVPLQPPPAPKSTYSHMSLFAPGAFDSSSSIPVPHSVAAPPPQQPHLQQPHLQQPPQPHQPPPAQHQPPQHHPQPPQHQIPPPHILAPSLLTHALASWRLSRSHLARSACLLYFPTPPAPDPTPTPTPTPGSPSPPPPPPPPPALSPHVLLALCHLVLDHASDSDTALDAARAIVGDARRAERQRCDEERARWARGVAEGVVGVGVGMDVDVHVDVHVDGGAGTAGADIPLYYLGGSHTTPPPLPVLIATHLSTHLPLPLPHSHTPPTPLTPSAHLLLSRLRPLLHPSLLPHASRTARTESVPLYAAVGHAVAGSAGAGEWDAVVGAVGGVGAGMGMGAGQGGTGPWGRRVDAQEVAVRVGVLVGKDDGVECGGVEVAEGDGVEAGYAQGQVQELEEEEEQGHVSMHDVHPTHASSSHGHPAALPLPFPFVPPNVHSHSHSHTDASFPTFPTRTSTTAPSTLPPTTLLPPSDVLYAPYLSVTSGSNGSWHPVLIRESLRQGCALCLAQGGEDGVGGVWEWKGGSWFCPSCTLLTSSTTSSPRSSPRIKPRPPPLDIPRALSASSSALLGLATPPPSASARDKSPHPLARTATPITHMLGAGLLTPFASPTRPVDSTVILAVQAPAPVQATPVTAPAPGTPNGLPKPTIRIPLRAFSNPRLKRSSSSLLSLLPLISPLTSSDCTAPASVGEVLTVAAVESEGRPRVTRANSVAMLEAGGLGSVQEEAAGVMGDSQSTLLGDAGSSSCVIMVTAVETSAKKVTTAVDVVVAVKVETVDEGGQIKAATQGVKRKRGGRRAGQVAAQ